MSSGQPQTRWPVTTDSSSGARVALPLVLRAFWIASLGAFGLTFLRAYAAHLAGVPRNGWDPLSDPLFGDLLEYVPTFHLLHREAFFANPVSSPVGYPPFAAVLYALIYWTGRPVLVYLVIALAALALAVWGVRRALIESGIGAWTATLFPLTLVLVSFPIEGLLQRGNIELFLWIFAAAGSWAYLRDREDAAAVLWGFAAAVKLYPLIFLVLLLARRKFRAFLIGAASFVLISVASLMYLGPSIAIAWRGSVHNVFGYQGIRVAEWSMHELAANHSFFGPVKLAAMMLGRSPERLTAGYYVCGGLIFGWVFVARLRKMPVANQLLGVSVYMLMLPPISYFYTLVHLYAPWLMLALLAIRAGRDGLRIPGLSAAILLFVPLFASFTLMTFRDLLLFAGLIQSLLLFFLFLCALQYPFAAPVREE